MRGAAAVKEGCARHDAVPGGAVGLHDAPEGVPVVERPRVGRDALPRPRNTLLQEQQVKLHVAPALEDHAGDVLLARRQRRGVKRLGIRAGTVVGVGHVRHGHGVAHGRHIGHDPVHGAAVGRARVHLGDRECEMLEALVAAEVEAPGSVRAAAAVHGGHLEVGHHLSMHPRMVCLPAVRHVSMTSAGFRELRQVRKPCMHAAHSLYS